MGGPPKASSLFCCIAEGLREGSMGSGYSRGLEPSRWLAVDSRYGEQKVSFLICTIRPVSSFCFSV